MHFSLSSPNLLARRPNLTLHPLGRVVIPRALEPPKFWQKWEVFMTLGERIKHMEYAARLGYRPCSHLEGRQEGRGLSFRLALWDPDPQGHISISPGASLLHRPQREAPWNPTFSLFASRNQS